MSESVVGFPKIHQLWLCPSEQEMITIILKQNAIINLSKILLLLLLSMESLNYVYVNVADVALGKRYTCYKSVTLNFTLA